MGKATPSGIPAEVPVPDVNPELTPERPELTPEHPEVPYVRPHTDPDLPEKPGPPLNDPENPHGKY
jgi:hypothetical protein